LSTVNIQHLNNIVNQINAAEHASCPQLELILKNSLPGIQGLIDGIQKEIPGLSAITAILSLPSPDPVSIVKWLGKLVTGIAVPQLMAEIQYAIQLVQLIQKLAEVTSKLGTLASKVEHCAIQAIEAPIIDVENLINSSMQRINALQQSLSSINPSMISSTLIDTSNVQNFVNSVQSQGTNAIKTLNGVVNPTFPPQL
jgi:hypothetical protein